MKEAIAKRYDELMNNLETELSRHYRCHDEYEAVEKKYEKAKGTKDQSDAQDKFIKTKVGCENALPTAQAIIEELQPFLMLKQAELQSEQKAILDRMEEESKKQSWHNKIALFLTGIMALLAIIISIVLGTLSLRSSRDWQEKQLPILEQIHDKMPIVTEQVKGPEKTTEIKE